MNKIDGKLFKEMLRGGARALEINKNVIDELNVFPVPDGDTGTNMSLTLSTAIREVNALQSDALDDIALAFSKGALKGARGNSGVILSQIIKGFAVTLDGAADFGAKEFAKALKKGTEIAYSAVTKPKEGTILTVVRVMAESAASAAKNKNIQFEDFFKKVIEDGESILLKTPEMLPVLAKAGVVDAGGRGLITVFDGLYRTLIGEDLPVLNGADVKLSDEAVLQNVKSFETLDNDYENITFQYCTEFFITHLKRETTEANVDSFRDYLMTIGDCVLVIGDLELVKTHVHTNNPDKALKAALKLGELDGVKIENMVEQHRKIVGEQEKTVELKDYAMISVCAGEGMAAIFNDLMVDIVVEGGQTMNPSVHDILGAINKAKAKNVFVLPNNGNIIMAATQAKELADVNVYVVPTTCVPEGISAALVFSPDADADEKYRVMCDSAKSVTSAEITHAVRSTRMNGFSVKEGDIIGIHNKKIVAKSQSVEEATLATAERISSDAEMLTLYYGEGVTEADAQRMAEKLSAAHPELEVASYYGGQPHYYYILSAE